MTDSTIKTIELRGSRKRALAGATLGFFFGFASVVLFGITVAYFREAMSLSPFMIGVLIAVPSLSGSLLRIPFGAWVDSEGGRTPFLVLLLLSLAGVALLFIVTLTLYDSGALDRSHYPLLLFAGVLSGCGIATFSVGIGQVSYWYPQERQGTALGVYAGLGNIAPGLFNLILPGVVLSAGISGTYGLWMFVILLGILLYAFLGFRPPYFQALRSGASKDKSIQFAMASGQTIFPKSGAWKGLLNAAKIWQTWALVIIYFVTFGGFIALTGWFPTYWKEFHQVSLTTAGILAGTFSVLASILRVLGGRLSDLLGGTRTLFISLGIMIAGALMLSTTGQFSLAITGVALLGIGMGVGNAAVFKLVPQAVSEAVGGAAGWVGGLGAFGGFVIPPVMGGFVDFYGAQGYMSGFLIFIGLSALALFCTLLIRKPGIPEKIADHIGRLAFDIRTGVIVSGTVTILAVIALFDPADIKMIDNQQGYAPEQPIRFSHKLHAGENEIPCLYCHGGAEKHAVAGIPSANVCMNCHTQIGKDRPEVQKIKDAIASEQVIRWNKVHDLPDFVRFNHSAHVNAGVECQMCHGNVGQMELLGQSSPLTMGWCVSCHRDYNLNPPASMAVRKVNASTDCGACHF